MSERILTYVEINRGEWSALVQTSATGTWFQTPEAYELYESLPELFRPFVVGIALDAERLEPEALELRSRLRGVCVGFVTVEKSVIEQFFTRRALILGGPCLADDCTDEEVTLLLRSLTHSLINSFIHSPIYIETRNFNDYSKWKEAFERAGFDYKEHLNYHVDCTDREKMWERLSENRKRQVRHRMNEGVNELESERVRELEIREWYGILKNLYKTKVKTPLWPVEFFLEAYRQGVGKFFLVKHEGKVIGGSMVVMSERMNELSNEGTMYEWFECGLNSEYKEQYPSVMATWAGMEYAAEHGCARYDMMGAGEPNVPYGVRDFKSEFGGKLVEHGRFLCICKPWLYKIGKLGVKLLKRNV